MRIFLGAAIATLWLLAVPAFSATINLSAYVYIALLDETGTTPLADGSIVQIIGSYDSIIDPIGTSGTNVTGSTTGDDVILATIAINSANLGSNGTFYVSNIFYESDDIKNMYIRFYDTTNSLVGMISWGESPMTNVEYDAFGSIVVDFIGGYSATNQNSFVVIPEPNTMSFILMWVGMVAALKSTMRQEGRKKGKGRLQRLLEPQETCPMNTYDKF